MVKKEIEILKFPFLFSLLKLSLSVDWIWKDQICLRFDAGQRLMTLSLLVLLFLKRTQGMIPFKFNYLVFVQSGLWNLRGQLNLVTTLWVTSFEAKLQTRSSLKRTGHQKVDRCAYNNLSEKRSSRQSLCFVIWIALFCVNSPKNNKSVLLRFHSVDSNWSSRKTSSVVTRGIPIYFKSRLNRWRLYVKVVARCNW